MAADDERRQPRRDAYIVPASYQLPRLDEGPDVDRVNHSSDAAITTHYDTVGAHLNSAGLALTRTRTADTTVWSLDLSGIGDHEPVTSTSPATTVPRELSSLLTAARGSQRVTSRLRVETAVDRYDLIDADGVTVAALVDERTSVTTPGPDAETVATRTLRIESRPAAKATRKMLRQHLREADARPNPTRQAVLRSPHQGPDRPTPKRLAGLIDVYLLAQFAELTRADLRLRLGTDAVHQARVAIRRIRSTLHVFSDVIDPGRATALNAELEWLSNTLGRVRDVQVVQPLIEADLDSLPADILAGGGRTRVARALSTELQSAWTALSAALAGRRYRHLVGLMDGWRTDPPYLAAEPKPRRSARAYVARTDRKATRRLRAATKRSADPAVVHRARKAAKRLRYATELAEPVLDEKQRKSQRRARSRQESLGSFQDVRVARDLLVRLGSSHDPDRPALALGYLAAVQQARGEDLHTALRRGIR